MRTLRIAFSNHIGNAVGGGELTLATFIKHLPPDFIAHAILFEDGDFANALRGLGVTVEVVRVASALFDSRRERLTLGAALAVPGAAIAMAAALRRLKIDVLYTNSMKAHVVGALAAKLAGVPCVMHFHDVMSGTGLKILRAAARFGSSRRVACSSVVSSTIGLPDTTVIYGPVELGEYMNLPSPEAARSALGLDPSVPTISLIGRINRWKGHDRFVRIAARVSKTRPVQFLIVGSPIFRDAAFLPELQAMVRDLKLENVVRFVPWVSDVRHVFAATDVNANCSTREPLGRTPAEAAAAGVPSVVFDDSGAAEWMSLAGEGQIVPAWDEPRFADAILSLLADGASSHSRADVIRRTAMRFDADAIAREMAQVIRDAAKP